MMKVKVTLKIERIYEQYNLPIFKGPTLYTWKRTTRRCATSLLVFTLT